MIKSIFAVDLSGGMGNAGSLPWPSDREDLRWFKEHTSGHVVIMGSKTWLDPMMPKPLPNRYNVVISDKPSQLFKGANMVIATKGLDETIGMIQRDNPGKDIWVIGGARTLLATKHLIKEVFLTEFNADFDCDVKIDVWAYLDGFFLESETHGDNKTFRIYRCKTTTTS